MAADAAPVALFDLDGTVTYGDTLTPYTLGYALRHPWRLPRLLMTIPVILAWLMKRTDRGGLKGSLIRACLGGVSRAQLAPWTQAFLDALFRSGTGLHADARREIEMLRSQGVNLILMSASPDLYVPEIGRRLGFARVICSSVRWEGDVLDGRLEGRNVRDEEKLRYLQELRREFPGARFSAYGNTGADLPHLLAADEGTFVNGSVKSTERAKLGGLRIVRWR